MWKGNIWVSDISFLFLFRHTDDQSKVWRWRHSSLSGSRWILHLGVKVEKIWLGVQEICLLLQREPHLWKLSASVISWSCGAERSRDEERKRVCDSEKRHRQWHWNIRVFCSREQQRTQKESRWPQTDHQPGGYWVRWVWTLTVKHHRSDVCVLLRWCWWDFEEQLKAHTWFYSAGHSAGRAEDGGNKEEGNLPVHVGLITSLVVVAAVVVCCSIFVFLVKRRSPQNSEQPAADGAHEEFLWIPES